MTSRKRLLAAMQGSGPGGRFILMPTAAPIHVPFSPKTKESCRRFVEAALTAAAY